MQLKLCHAERIFTFCIFTFTFLLTEKQLARLQACMLFKGSAKVRDGRITQHQAYIGYAQAFVVQQVLGVLHTLALVKFKNGGTKQLFKAFFQVALVDGHLAAQFFNGNGLTNMMY